MTNKYEYLLWHKKTPRAHRPKRSWGSSVVGAPPLETYDYYYYYYY
jgi:hypothetical protein